MQVECVFQHSHSRAQRSSPQRPFLGRSVALKTAARETERDIRLSLTPIDSSITVAPLLTYIAASTYKSRWRRWRLKWYFSSPYFQTARVSEYREKVLITSLTFSSDNSKRLARSYIHHEGDGGEGKNLQSL